jgi:hypothetical protein
LLDFGKALILFAGLSHSCRLCESHGVSPAASGGKNFGVWLVCYADQPNPKPHPVRLLCEKRNLMFGHFPDDDETSGHSPLPLPLPRETRASMVKETSGKGVKRQKRGEWKNIPLTPFLTIAE